MRYAIANWKMNPPTREEAVKVFSTLSSLLRPIHGVTVAVCPPFVWLGEFSRISRPHAKLALGAQDVFWMEQGAFTGEVSHPMLKSLGASYVIIGHSERRQHFGESNEMVAKKLAAVLDAGFHAVLCVGETTREGKWQDFLKEEFKTALLAVKPKTLSCLLVAYEPVWAVSTSVGWHADTPEDARASAIFLRRMLQDRFGETAARAVPILYGGSVNRSNIEGFAALEEISGALVGHASLDPVEFSEIVKILAHQK